MTCLRFIIFCIFISTVLLTISECKRSGGSRTSSRTSNSKPSNHFKHGPTKTYQTKQKQKVPKKTVINEFLKAERGSTDNNHKTIPSSNNFDNKHTNIGFDSVNKQIKNKHDRVPIGFDRVNEKTKETVVHPQQHNLNSQTLSGKYPNQQVPSAPLLPAIYQNQQHNVPGGHPIKKVPSAPPQPGVYLNQHIPSSPPLPGSYPNQPNIPMAPIMPGNYPNQHIPSAPPQPGFNPNHQNIPIAPIMPGNYLSQHIPSVPLQPGSYPNQLIQNGPTNPGTYINQQNIQPYPSQYVNSQHSQYPYLSPQNVNYNPNYSPAQNYQPSYPNPQTHSGFPYPMPGNTQFYGSQFHNTYPNQQSLGNQFSQLGYNTFPFQHQNFMNPNTGYPQPSSSSFNYNPSAGFFGTSNNGLNSYNSYYSPYPGYSGMNGNDYHKYKKPKRTFIPIPIPLPIPFPTSWDSNNLNSDQLHDLFKKVMTQIEDKDKNDTSVFIINNSTVTPCDKEEFVYHGGKLNLTIMTCTLLNCTAVRMTTSFNNTKEIVQNNGVVMMCLNPNATVTTNHSGSAFPTISVVENYWKMNCLDKIQPNDKYTNFTNLGQNFTHSIQTYSFQNDSSISLINGTNNEQNINDTKTDSEFKVDIPQLPNVQDLIMDIDVRSNFGENDYNKTEDIPIQQSDFKIHDQNKTTPLDFTIDPIKINLNDSTLQNKTLGNSTMSLNTTQVCEVMDCSSVKFCLPTVEIVCTDPLNVNCTNILTSFKPCVQVKMCKSPSIPIDRVVKLNTTISKYDHTTNNLTEKYELYNLTVITYFPPAIINSNYTSVNGTDNFMLSVNSTASIPLNLTTSIPSQQSTNSSLLNIINSTEYINLTALESVSTKLPDLGT
uniref:Uncharacterized protein n=1 Tax=Clastoptera arizonana TaxID=38151 RepID=A0A1B6DS21_9HEMI